MGDIVVRKARKDYVCDVCGRIIKSGSEYLDKVIVKYGTPVKHERYHDECPDEGFVMRLWRRLLQADGDLMASDPEGNKYFIYGIAKIAGGWCVNTREWGEEHGRYTSIQTVMKWRDAEGKPL